MDLQLSIVTPERAVFSGKASQVVLPGWLGQVGVLPQHDNFLALVKSGVTTVSGSDGDKKFVVGRGFAEVTSAPGKGGWTTSVTILTETCESASDVDKVKAQKELDEAEKALTETEPNSERRRVVEARIELARARLSV